MGSVKYIQRWLILACWSGLCLGWIGIGAGQAAGAPVWPAVQAGRNTTASCSVPGALEGVDVSEYQGTIAWAQVAQTKAFAYASVGDGITHSDPTFLTNYAGIKKVGMKAGAYLFFRPAQDPTQQANILVSQVLKAGLAPGDLVPMIDVEVSDGKTGQEIAASLQTAVDVVKKALFVTPVIQTDAPFWNDQIGSAAFASIPLWIAHWTVNCPTLPLPWKDWAFWNYTGSGTVPGINYQVDLDRSNGASLPVYSGGVRRIFLPVIVAFSKS